VEKKRRRKGSGTEGSASEATKAESSEGGGAEETGDAEGDKKAEGDGGDKKAEGEVPPWVLPLPGLARGGAGRVRLAVEQRTNGEWRRVPGTWYRDV